LVQCRFKKSGEFDRLRRELLTQFQNGVRFNHPLHFGRTIFDFYRMEPRRFGRAWTTLRAHVSTRRTSCTSKQQIRSTESCSRNSIGDFFFHPSLPPSLPSFLLLSSVLWCRFPLVERAVADVPALADPEFAAGVRSHAQNLLRRSRGISGAYAPPIHSLLPTPRCIVNIPLSDDRTPGW